LTTVVTIEALRTVTDVGAVVLAFPFTSVARAVMETLPSGTVVEFQVTENGVVASVPTKVAPMKKSTLATPTLSDAVALIVTLAPETVAPDAGVVRLTVGSVVSFRTVTVLADEIPIKPVVPVAFAVSE
jgi:hypothetical protein